MMQANFTMIDPQKLPVPYLPDDVAVTHDYLLNKKVQIIQRKNGYRAGSDAILAAASLSTRRGQILDLGAGVGAISLCVAQRLDAIQITALEIDPVAAMLARYNAEINGVERRLRVVEADITAMPSIMAGSFDHVISNPPYHYKAGTHPRDATRAMAHMGADTSLRDWVKASVWATRPRGRISFICRADRAPELISMFDLAGAGETLLFPLWSRPMSPASRVIIQLRKGVVGPGAILPGLVMHNDDGSFTEAAQHIMKGESLYLVHPARAR